MRKLPTFGPKTNWPSDSSIGRLSGCACKEAAALGTCETDLRKRIVATVIANATAGRMCLMFMDDYCRALTQKAPAAHAFPPDDRCLECTIRWIGNST